MYKKILLPTDGSKFASKATEHALWIASHCDDVELIVLSVIETSFVIGLPVVDTTDSIKKMLRKEAEDNVQKVLKKAKELNYDFKITTKIEEGSASTRILDLIDEDDDIELVVLGTSGKTGFDKFILGSVANNVVRSANCPVLVVN